jgi:hypothetical protein
VVWSHLLHGEVSKRVGIGELDPLTEVELPDTDSLADLAVKEVRPDHNASVSFEKRRLRVSYDIDNIYETVRLEIDGDKAIQIFLKEGRRGVGAKVILFVSGLTALGLAEKAKPGVTGEILRKVREAVRERLRDLVTTELFYSMLREMYRWQAWGE